jgi:hypothetical protein
MTDFGTARTGEKFFGSVRVDPRRHAEEHTVVDPRQIEPAGRATGPINDF